VFAFGIFTTCIAAVPSLADAILFDASKHEMGGNADWVIDADAWNLSMPAYPCSGNTNESNPGRYPTPAQSGIGPSTPQTYWTGGISAWGIELVKAGHTVESLPNGAAITYGDGGNPQDLSNYDLFIVPEPQNPFTAAEKTAILNFVFAGGGFFMVADHETSDRDCDGWDSPEVFNDLTGATSGSSAGFFGIWFRVDGLEVKGEDWFDDGVNSNVNTDPSDPIIFGPFGDGSGGLGLFGATSMDIDLSKATAHVWRTGQTHNNLRVTFATATYGAGRVAAIGDSSPADDDSGDPSDSLYPGWDLASGGVKNKEIHLNACHWLLNPTPDTTDPVITAGPSATAADCSATVTWTTDEAATSSVVYGLTTAYGSTASTAGHTTAHSVAISGLAPSTTYHYQVSSTDPSGNGPTQSTDHTFTTLAGTAPSITAGPAATNVGGTSATITWTTDEVATSSVDYGLTGAYGSSASTAGYATSHSVLVTGLTPETLYHYQVHSTDSCANGPTSSTDATFTTGPASLDISGWVLKQFNSTQTFTIPAGTTIPSGGYLVLGREATRAEFEAVHTAMPSATVYLNSNASGSCSDGCFPLINGAETFELWNGTTMEDGTTISMATGNAYQRKNPGDPANASGSWTTVGMASANPGQGAGTPSGAGVVINEMSDASSWPYEFIELYYDAGAAQSDTTAPAAVADLSALALSDTQIRISWTAPGDDGSTGTATAYDLRRSSSAITSDGLFTAATPVTGLSAPQGAGSAEQFVVTGLSASTTYHFAIKTRDEVPNWSALSNSPSATTSTSSDVTPPAPIADLVATPLSDTQIQLTWTARGDDGITGTLVAVGSYDIYRKATRMLTLADLTGATQSSFSPTVGPGSQEQTTITDLTANTPYYFVVRAKDEVPNLAGLSNCAAGTTALTGGGGGTNHLVISQIQTGGDGSPQTAEDEFYEIYNPTASSVSMAGMSLQYKSASGSTYSVQTLSATIPSHKYYLVARASYNGPTHGFPAADLTTTLLNVGGTGGNLFLVNGTTALSGTCSTDSSIIDKVAWGTGNCPETTATSAPAINNSVQRKPGGTSGSGTDTGNNSTDFQSLIPSAPHSSASGAATPPSSLGNVGPTLYLDGPGTADLEWANAAGATGGYRVYRGTAGNFMAGSPSPWQTVATNSLTDSATPSPIFFYVIRATDGTNESAD
jgi:chitodextrinase